MKLELLLLSSKGSCLGQCMLRSPFGGLPVLASLALFLTSLPLQLGLLFSLFTDPIRFFPNHLASLTPFGGLLFQPSACASNGLQAALNGSLQELVGAPG
jgi:hypothetical protein